MNEIVKTIIEFGEAFDCIERFTERKNNACNAVFEYIVIAAFDVKLYILTSSKTEVYHSNTFGFDEDSGVYANDDAGLKTNTRSYAEADFEINQVYKLCRRGYLRSFNKSECDKIISDFYHKALIELESIEDEDEDNKEDELELGDVASQMLNLFNQ